MRIDWIESIPVGKRRPDQPKRRRMDDIREDMS